MSDNWIKDAEKKRQMDHGEHIGESNNGLQRTRFWWAHRWEIRTVLRQLGQTWKAQDPNRSLLFIPLHRGNDYYIETVGPEFLIGLYLFDKTNLNLKFNIIWLSRYTKTPDASIYVKFFADSFSIIRLGPDSILKKDLKTVDQVKTTLAQLWETNQIKLATIPLWTHDD
jgi:hypothetical protein